MLSRQKLGEYDTFARSLVRQHRRTGDIANGVDALGGGLHLLVDLDEAALGKLNSLLLEPDVLDVRSASRGNEHLLDFEIRFLPPASSVMSQKFLPTFTLPIFAPTMTSIFRFLNALASSAEQSASSRGRMDGATSISVT